MKQNSWVICTHSLCDTCAQILAHCGNTKIWIGTKECWNWKGHGPVLPGWVREGFAKSGATWFISREIFRLSSKTRVDEPNLWGSGRHWGREVRWRPGRHESVWCVKFRLYSPCNEELLDVVRCNIILRYQQQPVLRMGWRRGKAWRQQKLSEDTSEATSRSAWQGRRTRKGGRDLRFFLRYSWKKFFINCLVVKGEMKDE